MIELALGAAGDRANVDVGFVFFGREELPFADSALSRLLEREPGLRDRRRSSSSWSRPTTRSTPAAWATSTRRWTFPGVSGHSARPWFADNAIHRAAAGIDALAQDPRRAARVRRADASPQVVSVDARSRAGSPTTSSPTRRPRT